MAATSAPKSVPAKPPAAATGSNGKVKTTLVLSEDPSENVAYIRQLANSKEREIYAFVEKEL